MIGLQILSYVEEMMVPTSSQPAPVKYRPEVKNKDQDPGQRSNGYARKEHPFRSQMAPIILAVWPLCGPAVTDS